MNTDGQDHSNDKASDSMQVLLLLKEKIISQWESKARKALEVARVQESLVLRNTLAELVDAIVAAVEIPASVSTEVKEAGASEKNFEKLGSDHAKQCFDLGTYSIRQLLQEYRWLRQELGACLNERRPMTWAEQLIVQDAFDTAIEGAVEEFAKESADYAKYTAIYNENAGAMKEENRLLLSEKNELVRSNKDLSAFAYTAAHDLRAPLDSILKFVELISGQSILKIEEKSGRDYVAQITRAATRMRVLIEKLLLLGRLGERAQVFQSVDLNGVLKTTLENLDSTIRSSGAKVESDLLPVVFGDECELNQVFQNLISNALKFKREKAPEIQIRMQPSPQSWHISIRDNGIGIKAEHLAKIFRPFLRLNPEDEFEGAGLGLAICEKIIAHHDGEIWAESKAGCETTVHFTLPKTQNVFH